MWINVYLFSFFYTIVFKTIVGGFHQVHQIAHPWKGKIKLRLAHFLFPLSFETISEIEIRKSFNKKPINVMFKKWYRKNLHARSNKNLSWNNRFEICNIYFFSWSFYLSKCLNSFTLIECKFFMDWHFICTINRSRCLCPNTLT